MSQALSTTTLNLNLLGDWQPPADRRDPIAVLEQQEIDRLPWLVPVRHSRMAQNAFAFYRGTPAVMAHDLGHAPSSGLEVQLCGDCHLANFGFYGSPEWHLLFDINDFDETVRGPFEWDLKRLVASAVLAARALKLPAEQQRRAARRTARSYRHAMCALAAQPLQQIWAQRIDMEAFVAEVGHEPLRRHLERMSAKAKARTNSEAAGKLCEFGPDGALQLRHDPPLIWRHALLDRHWTADMHWRELVDEMLLKYMASLPAELQHLMHHFRLADAALKAVGIGSVGTRCAIGLFVGHHPDEVLILQSKQAETSVLAPYASSPPPPHHGQRVVEGHRLMQTASDPSWAGAQAPTAASITGANCAIGKALWSWEPSMPKAWSSTASSAAKCWPKLTPALAMPEPSLTLQGKARCLIGPWRAMPWPMRISQNVTTGFFCRPSKKVACKPD